MTNKNMHAFVGEVIEPNQSDVSPIVCITAGSDNHPTSVSEAAHMLVAQQKAQGRTVAYLAPVDIQDPIKFLDVLPPLTEWDSRSPQFLMAYGLPSLK